MENKDQFSLNLRPEIAKGNYSNLAVISHSQSEFIIDFAEALPGMPQPEIGSRIIMAPEHAKRLLSALADNINKYESQFGEIQIQNAPKATYNLGDFNPNGTKS